MEEPSILCCTWTVEGAMLILALCHGSESFHICDCVYQSDGSSAGGLHMIRWSGIRRLFQLGVSTDIHSFLFLSLFTHTVLFEESNKSEALKQNDISTCTIIPSSWTSSNLTYIHGWLSFYQTVVYVCCFVHEMDFSAKKSFMAPRIYELCRL